MAKCVGVVLFEDATKLYLIYDGMLDKAMRPLFPTENAAREALAPGARMPGEQDDAKASEEAVTIIPDIAFVRDGMPALAGSFASRASKKALWLTGPRSFMEMAYENGATANRDL